MKRQRSFIVWVVIVILAWIVILHWDGPGAAQEADEEPAAAAVGMPLQAVSVPNNRLGFFDPATQRLYVYGPDLRNAVMVVEIGELGQPLRLVQRTGR